MKDKEFELKCKYCNNGMFLDDVDFNFRGNKDNYFICTVCNSSAIEKIRYGRSIKIEWFKESD